jgi:hypothetical protein
MNEKTKLILTQIGLLSIQLGRFSNGFRGADEPNEKDVEFMCYLADEINRSSQALREEVQGAASSNMAS